MTTPKHTPEPWYAVNYAGFLNIQQNDLYGSSNLLAMDEDNKAIFNAERIVSCVNAMQGIEDPAKFIEEHHKLVECLNAAEKQLSEMEERLAEADKQIKDVKSAYGDLWLKQSVLAQDAAKAINKTT